MLSAVAALAELPPLGDADVVFIPPAPDRVDWAASEWPESRIAPHGRIEMECRITAEARFADCRVIKDEVVNADLKPVALRMASIMSVEPKTRSDEGAAGRLIRVAIVFAEPEGD